MSFDKTEEGNVFVGFGLLLKYSEDSLKEEWISSRVVAISEIRSEATQIIKGLFTGKR